MQDIKNKKKQMVLGVE